MVALGLDGPWKLEAGTIDAVIVKKRPGNFALGDIDKDRVFEISRVGRSDYDLNGRLHFYIGEYQQFKAGYANSTKAAFEKECHNYHDFSPPDNKIHPERPDGTTWKCPRCRVFD